MTPPLPGRSSSQRLRSRLSPRIRIVRFDVPRDLAVDSRNCILEMGYPEASLRRQTTGGAFRGSFTDDFDVFDRAQPAWPLLMRVLGYAKLTEGALRDYKRRER